ncbi:Bax inhibitor-1/YccA family protein [Candidatus Omnitrophota bacterium]
MRSGNPALRHNAFNVPQSYDSENAMTIQGTVNKTFFLLFLCVLSASWVWGRMQLGIALLIPAAIVGFIVGLVTVFNKRWAGITAPIYALVEGVVVGAISSYFEKTYPGIVIQAVSLTFGTLFCLLLAYKSRLIKVTENFKLGVVAATGSVMMIYAVNLILSFFGIRIPFIHESGIIGIGFSLVVIVIASLNLVLDFDFIEKGAENGAPRYLEWYGAFGLMVTLIWLYLEILRLLAKLRRR